MKQFQLYTHPKMLDCIILVLKSYRIKPGDYSVKATWYNRNGMCLGFTQRLRIRNANEWIPLEIYLRTIGQAGQEHSVPNVEPNVK